MRSPSKTVARSILLRLKRVQAEDEGAALFEFALVLPLLLTLLLGIFWMARAYNVYQTITRAAREGARTAAVNSCASCGNAVASDSSIQQAVFNSLQASSLDTSKVTSSCPDSLPSGLTCPSSYCGTGTVCIVRDYPLNSGAPRELGVVVSFRYPVDFPIPFVNLGSFNIGTSVQMRQE